MNDPYTEDELKYIREHYKSDGYTAVAAHLGRTTAAIRTRAHMLGVTNRYRPKTIDESERRNILRCKADVTKNGDDGQLKQLMIQRVIDDKDKVMLKIKHNTWVMVPRYLATPEHAELLRKRYENKGRF